MDTHTVAGVREAIEAAGATVRLLPVYSPDLNPIEQVFAKLKAHLRSRNARSVDGLWRAVGSVVTRITAHECANYIRNAGYFWSG